MADAERTDLPLDVEAGAAGAHASAAFGLLGNETRLAILLALWERYDPHTDDNAVPFSELFDMVAYDNPGNFSYHLEQLTGQFVHQRTERGGYELRLPGLKLVKAVVAGAGLQNETRAATEIDQPCPLCGAPTVISYREGLLFHACTECEGPVPDQTEMEGFLSATPFEPAGLSGRSPAELRAASRVASIRQIQTMFDGVCPTCSGPVDGWLDYCPDHESGLCEHCGTRFVAWARFECRVCKDHGNTSPKALALLHPAVMGFYDDHGVSTRFRADDVESVARGFELMDAHTLALVSRDPPRVEVTIEHEEDTLVLVFDETVDVVDVRR